MARGAALLLLLKLNALVRRGVHGRVRDEEAIRGPGERRCVIREECDDDELDFAESGSYESYPQPADSQTCCWVMAVLPFR